MFNLLNLLGPYKWPVVIGAVLVALTALWAAIAIHDHNVRQQALAEFNKKQLEQVIADQKKYMEQLKLINETQKEIAKSLREKNDDLNSKIDEIQKELQVKAPGANNQSSEYLKETVKQLGRFGVGK